MKQLAICTIIAMTMVLTACDPPEMVARDAIASAKGFLDAEAKVHPECANGPTSQVCALVTKGNAAKHVAIDALMQYCTSPEFDAGTATCTKPTGPAGKVAESQLRAAVSNLNRVISDIKALK